MNLSRAHGMIGFAGLIAFVLTGQYMDRWHDHLRGTDDVRRLAFRSTHIYLLFTSLLNMALRLANGAGFGWRRRVAKVGSMLILLALGARICSCWLLHRTICIGPRAQLFAPCGLCQFCRHASRCPGVSSQIAFVRPVTGRLAAERKRKVGSPFHAPHGPQNRQVRDWWT